jgi:eukaryotic-like serine/threonine-protein kinase
MAASREHRQQLYEQLVGRTIADRFEITSLLGFGGMGAVYEAVQRNMQRKVALKVIPSHDPTTTARFKREALTISKLHHPNTVTVFDYGETDRGLLFLAMEKLSGGTLTDLIQREAPLEPARAVHIASQVSRSLGEAHSSDIVHRDIKPDNIFLIEVDDDPNFVKVLDFGIAKIVRGEDNVELTGTGRIIGTPKYMSPEQILAEPVDHRSDLYSLGCILFEMLCATPPFQDTSTTKLMLAHAHQAPPTFAERLPNEALGRIPGPLEQVVRKALSKSPSERHADTDAFRYDLELALEATDQLIDPSQATRSTHVQPAPATSELTDSSDLLSQHSSQTLAELNEPAPQQQPAPQPQDQTVPPSSSGSMKPAVYAIGGVLGIIVALVAYSMLVPGEKLNTADEQPVETVEPTQVDNAPLDVVKAAVDPADEPAELVEVRVVTEPEGAQVYDDGRYIGKTPMGIEAQPDTKLAYRFELEDHHDKDASYYIDPDEPAPLFIVELDQEEDEEASKPKRTRRPPRKSTSPKKRMGISESDKTSESDQKSESDPPAEDEDPAEEDDPAKGEKKIRFNIDRLDDEPRIDRLDD